MRAPLRLASVEGRDSRQACRAPVQSRQSFSWRKEYGGMGVDQTRLLEEKEMK